MILRKLLFVLIVCVASSSPAYAARYYYAYTGKIFTLLNGTELSGHYLLGSVTLEFSTAQLTPSGIVGLAATTWGWGPSDTDLYEDRIFSPDQIPGYFGNGINHFNVDMNGKIVDWAFAAAALSHISNRTVYIYSRSAGAPPCPWTGVRCGEGYQVLNTPPTTEFYSGFTGTINQTADQWQIFGIEYSVNSSVGVGNGTISPLGEQWVASGKSMAYVLTPSPGWRIESVGGTCGGSLLGFVYSIDPVDEDCSVVSNFELVPDQLFIEGFEG